MGLADMVSQFQPGGTSPGDALAEGGGLENATNAGSTLNIDSTPGVTNGLAEAGPYDGIAQNGQGLETITNPGSILNIDSQPADISNGLANGIGLASLAADDSELDIDGQLSPSTGLANLSLIPSGYEGAFGNGTGISTLNTGTSTFDINGQPNDMSDGLASTDL
tara:strand:- start:124 stop:618 length:495 start_codon:yes stop_codon:yes gene_type:complete